MKPYEVIHQSFDAARPWSVIRNFRGFNRIAGRYATKRAAQKRASQLTRAFNPARAILARIDGGK